MAIVTMEEREWIGRFERHLVVRGGITAGQAAQVSRLVPFEDRLLDYADDPEGAAEEEMSYWSEA